MRLWKIYALLTLEIYETFKETLREISLTNLISDRGQKYVKTKAIKTQIVGSIAIPGKRLLHTLMSDIVAGKKKRKLGDIFRNFKTKMCAH